MPVPTNRLLTKLQARPKETRPGLLFFTREPGTADGRVADRIATMSATAEIDARFSANMAALYRRDARLADAIDRLGAADDLQVEASARGVATASRVGADGKRFYLHSRHDPVGEAERLCAAGDERECMCAVVCGMGLGYHVRALLEELGPAGVVLVSEPHLPTLRAALEQSDLADAISANRLVFITTADKPEIHEKLTPMSALLMLGTRLVVPPAARSLDAAFHAACRRNILDFAAFSKMSLVTLIANSRVTCENIVGNLPAYLGAPTLEILRGRYGGHAAIVVSAGPSLAKNIDFLSRATGRAVIIAVQTTLKPLLARGIRPDFVTTLDFSDLSRRFFEGIEDFGGATMVAEPKAAYAVVDAFRGRRGAGARRVVFLNNEFAQRCVGGELAGRAGLAAGSTVAHLSFYLAEHLGCDPIVFVGQDLGFTGAVYYTPGVTIHDAWRPELGRFCSLEQKEWERIVRHRPILRRAVDVNGLPIYTDEQMFTYLEQFERDFSASRAQVIDATEGGVRKTGTTVMGLAEVIERYCRREISDAATSWRGEWRYDVERVRAGRVAIERRRSEVASFRKLCEETRDVLGRLETVVSDPPAFNRLIVRVDELRTAVRSHDEVFGLVSEVTQLAELQKFWADRRLAAEGLEGREKSVRQLARDVRFVDALLDGCAAVDAMFELALRRFDEELAAGGSA